MYTIHEVRGIVAYTVHAYCMVCVCVCVFSSLHVFLRTIFRINKHSLHLLYKLYVDVHLPPSFMDVALVVAGALMYSPVK